MEDSDDEDFVFYGTPLDPIEEDEPLRKRPVTVEEMEATDKHGRRRFHGAFTGGFSAGFFNTVGSLEGWKPSTFKSSRSERAKFASQAPEDFMDDEDTDEFGIAPKSLQAKPEYGGGKKREREVGMAFHSGPIPGEPVLKSILKPARETIGLLLLVKMGWRPGQGIGPRLTRLQRKAVRANRARVYSCSVKPADSSSDDSGDELLAPEDWPSSEMPQPKVDTSGMGYVGLGRPTASVDASASSPFTFVDTKNRRLAIAGQAFGVGAFEEEDENIYAIEDKSNYDFSLEPVSTSKKKSRFSDLSKPLAITDGSAHVLSGFVEAKELVRKKFYPPPELPPGYVPVHQVKKSRFDPAPMTVAKGPTTRLNAESRAAIIASPSDRIKIEPVDETEEGPVATASELGWLPFASDPEKQERYERFLNFVKIGAKDAFSRIQPHTMTDLERERELGEFEAAAKLYKPLAGFLKERFTHGDVKQENEIKREVEEKVERLHITKETWYPHDLVCKRFNIPNPHGERGGEMINIAKETEKRKKFNLFDFLANPVDVKGSQAPETPSTSSIAPETAVEESSDSTPDASDQVQETLLNEDPPDKMDLYKAIFESSDEEEKEEEPPPAPEPVNALRNTSPPRGIFANIDFEALNRKPVSSKPETTPEPKASSSSELNTTKESEKKIESEVDPSDLFGPALPTKPLYTKTYKSVSLDVEDDLWVEKTSSSSDKSKHKHHKHKKHKKEKKKKEKHKKKKKSRYSDSD